MILNRRKGLFSYSNVLLLQVNIFSLKKEEILKKNKFSESANYIGKTSFKKIYFES